MRLLSLLLALATAVSATFAQSLPSVPNGSFNRLNEFGAIAWWSPGAWGAPKSTEPIKPETLAGLNFIKIHAMDGKGATGISSPGISAANLRDGFRLTFDIRPSPDYQGNTPWVFLYWTADDKTFQGQRTDMVPLKIGAPDRWTTISHDVHAAKIPDAADRVSINFASNARTGASGATGWFGVANVKIEPLGGSAR